jgi:hypothetical protein
MEAVGDVHTSQCFALKVGTNEAAQIRDWRAPITDWLSEHRTILVECGACIEGHHFLTNRFATNQ